MDNGKQFGRQITPTPQARPLADALPLPLGEVARRQPGRRGFSSTTIIPTAAHLPSQTKIKDFRQLSQRESQVGCFSSVGAFIRFRRSASAPASFIGRFLCGELGRCRGEPTWSAGACPPPYAQCTFTLSKLLSRIESGAPQRWWSTTRVADSQLTAAARRPGDPQRWWSTTRASGPNCQRPLAAA